MGKGILSGVFWGIVASALVAVVLTVLSPLPRDQATPDAPDEPAAGPTEDPAVPVTSVVEAEEPEAVEESAPAEPDVVVEATPEASETPAPEPAAEPAPVPETVEAAPEAPQAPVPAPEIEAPDAPQLAETQPDPVEEVAPEPETETPTRPEPLPDTAEVAEPAAPAVPADPVELPEPEVAVELAVPDVRKAFDAAPETMVPSLDTAALSDGMAPGLSHSARSVSTPSAGESVLIRPNVLDGPEMPRPTSVAGLSPETSIGTDSETMGQMQAPALVPGESSTDARPDIPTATGPRPGTLSGPQAPAFSPPAIDAPSTSDSDGIPQVSGDAPVRVALATDASEALPEFDTRSAVPQPPKAPETQVAAPVPEAAPAPEATPAPEIAETPATPEVAPAPALTEPDPKVAAVDPEAVAPAPTPAAPETGSAAVEIEPEEPEAETPQQDRTTTLPKVIAPGTTRSGGLPRVRRLGQLGTSSPGIGKSGPGLSQRIPRIIAPGETPEVPVVPEVDDTTPVGALERNAVNFSDDSGRPLMALVVVADGDAASLVSRVDGLGGQVTVVLDPANSAMRSVAPDLKARGHEVLILAEGLPANPTPRDVEVSLSSYITDYPDAVGILLPPDGAIASDRALLKQAMEFAAASGHAVVTAQTGLDTAGRIAAGAGAQALGVYRRLDGAGESASTVSRTLDRATFQAARDGQVAVLGGMGDATIAGLTEWRAGLRGDSVVLAPLSALILGGV